MIINQSHHKEIHYWTLSLHHRMHTAMQALLFINRNRYGGSVSGDKEL